LVRNTTPADTPKSLKYTPKIKKKVQEALEGAKKTALDSLPKEVGGKTAAAIASILVLNPLEDIVNIQPQLVAVAEEAAKMWIASINVPGDTIQFERVSERALAYAQKQAAELVAGIEETTRAGLKALIARGIEDNIGMPAIADSIAAAYDFSPERAELIAQTEIAFANQNGVLQGMHEAKELGIKIKKFWIPDAAACDVCRTNGDAGAIELNADFPSGDQTAPAHPRCRCTIGSEIQKD